MLKTVRPQFDKCTVQRIAPLKLGSERHGKNDVRARADLNMEVTLFRRFGSKANLLRTAILNDVTQFGGEAGIPHTGDVEADLNHVVNAYAGILKRRGRMIPLLLAELPRHPELADVVEVPHLLLDRIAELVARYQGEGVLIAEPPMRAVASLLAPLLVPALLGRLAPAQTREPLDVGAHVAAFLHGHRAAEAE